jgi:protein-S-isoprenylcysteine O-methyltransferase Ste14
MDSDRPGVDRLRDYLRHRSAVFERLSAGFLRAQRKAHQAIGGRYAAMTIQQHANKAFGLALFVAGSVQAQVPTLFGDFLTPSQQGAVTAIVGIIVGALDWWADQNGQAEETQD